MTSRPSQLASAIALLAFAGLAAAQDGDSEELTEITVTATRVANTEPAASYATVATALRYDPSTELQSRGLPEGQADVTVFGGLFENTGFRAGAVTVMDPQTGHYVAELPLDPGLFTAPRVLTGIDNALSGFNASIATIDYAFASIDDGGGAVRLGAGSDSLLYQSLRFSATTATPAGTPLGVSMSAAHSTGDGTVPNGDHDFSRFNVLVQRDTGTQQSHFVIGYQDKFYGWPGAYTGFASLPETDHTRTTLLLGNHRMRRDAGFVELGAFYRRLEDDYDFNRNTSESGRPGSFDHETRVFGIGIEGLHEGGRLNWRYAGQLSSDELVYSTDLTAGDFTSRDYASLSVVPSLQLGAAADHAVDLQFGATLDWSSRDGSAVSPVLAATWRSTAGLRGRFVTLEYVATSQLPGYTALRSPPAGLFGGNADLGREKANQLSLSAGTESAAWDGRLTVFYRRDDDLVDWTYASGAPFARQANAVDIDVLGIEVLARRRWSSLEIVGSYTYIDKDADYGSAVVDASFYALNFATHRATFAMRCDLGRNLELRLDSEYRRQRENPLRASSDEALLASLALAWEPSDGLGLALMADNLADDDYQQFPGTPAVGRQVSVSATYRW